MRSEFQFINDIRSRFDLKKVGDDCAVLPKDDKTDLLITSDMLVENVDFRLDWATPEQIGYKSLAVSLSDIAAMGGTPKHAMLSIAIVENLWKGDFLDRFYEGWHNLAHQYGVELIGGDISSTSGPLTIDSTVLGEATRGRALLRSGAKPGDGIYVTGTIGGAAAGLRLMLEGQDLDLNKGHSLLEQHFSPKPQLSMAKLLQEQGLANAVIDISDGLSSDLTHICEASGVGAEIEAELLPVDPGVHDFFNSDECLDMALNGGEDFQLLFTGDEKRVSEAGLPQVTRIGTITADPGLIELISADGRTPLTPKGYQHF